MIAEAEYTKVKVRKDTDAKSLSGCILRFIAEQTPVMVVACGHLAAGHALMASAMANNARTGLGIRLAYSGGDGGEIVSILIRPPQLDSPITNHQPQKDQYGDYDDEQDDLPEWAS